MCDTAVKQSVFNNFFGLFFFLFLQVAGRKLKLKRIKKHKSFNFDRIPFNRTSFYKFTSRTIIIFITKRWTALYIQCQNVRFSLPNDETLLFSWQLVVIIISVIVSISIPFSFRMILKNQSNSIRLLHKIFIISSSLLG